MMTHPGKKLNFMGGEIAMFQEWDESREPDWDLLKLPAHDAFLRFMTALNACYERESALWARDAACDGFRWAESVSDNPCVFGYTRTDGESVDLILLNFSDREAALSLGGEDAYTVLLSTSWEEFGGREKKADAPPKALSPYGGLLLRRTKSSPSVK